MFGDECRAEGFAQRLDDSEAGRWRAARRREYLQGEVTELWVIVVAVGCFGADADAPVVVDGDFQIGGMEFAVVGERQAVPVGTQPAEAVVCSVGMVDDPAGPGIVDEPGCGEGEY